VVKENDMALGNEQIIRQADAGPGDVVGIAQFLARDHRCSSPVRRSS
jgi:hypothetical protein